MLVQDVMIKKFVTVRPEMSWQEAAILLLENQTPGAPVVDAAGLLVGILSEKDLFKGLFPTHAEWAKTPHAFLDFQEMENSATDFGGKTVADVMTKEIITATPDTPVLKIGALMIARGIHHVPVVEWGRPIGMVNRGKIYRAILNQYLNRQN